MDIISDLHVHIPSETENCRVYSMCQFQEAREKDLHVLGPNYQGFKGDCNTGKVER